MKKESVLVERTFDTPLAKVWSAISDNSELKEWYFDIEEFEPKVGFTFDFLAGSEEKKFFHLCEVTEVEEEKKLAYTWRYDNYPGNSTVCWELKPVGEKTLLRLTHTGLETFAEAGPEFTRESFTEGWNYFMHDALKNYIEG